MGNSPTANQDFLANHGPPFYANMKILLPCSTSVALVTYCSISGKCFDSPCSEEISARASIRALVCMSHCSYLLETARAMQGFWLLKHVKSLIYDKIG